MSGPVTFTAAGTSTHRNPGGGRDGAPASLQRAFLERREPPPGGGTAAPSSTVIDTIDFQFNPKELNLTKAAKWGRNPQAKAKKAGPPEFLGSEPAKLSLELFFDATEKMDDAVVNAVEKLFSCTVPYKKFPTPPWVIFHWGGLTSFAGFLKTVTAKYTLFTPGGMPVRAVCTASLEEISGEQGGQNPTSGALAARDVHVVVAGDTLQSVAHRAYGNAALWRAVAEANGVDDPLRLAPGRRLLVPGMEELDHGQ
ncbi:peptidase M23 [Longispora fulva]|uniref:Nucleoid-associated protein YgaU n=1 Tax=Longispora fulva TaxID=619741 RepID=A0A8J7KNK9_9ACTN|nr:LysM peptidoglycan-binding domain-containing protein [Longispora fulva]MBG6141709.1 nucleoid-associated protein YgaU [Longispora fulva]GIG59136.1 peptidase M23 [Longispora fulva]